jgi:RNA polymerase sigma-70 factor, ECF subfamily
MGAKRPETRKHVNRDSTELAHQAAIDDLTLVHACLGGDVAAFEELVKRYDRRLLRIALNVTHNQEDAEEVVQDSFFKAYRNLSQFEGKAQFSTWLIRIALNESLMKLRKQRGPLEVSLETERRFDEEFVPLDVADWTPNPEERYGASEFREILAKTLQELRPALRMVLVLRDVEGFSISETAEVLTLTQVAVKARLFRARLELREKLSKYFRKPSQASADSRLVRTPDTTAKALSDGIEDGAASNGSGTPLAIPRAVAEPIFE